MMPDVPPRPSRGSRATRPAFSTGWPRPPVRRSRVIDRLNKELRAALASPEVKKRLATEGAEALPSTPQEYAADIDREETIWSKLIKSIGLKAK